jgi:7,8-dihydropterin-6-yl-methyl-4-(beta-D-ribofuranosyl)aminobenzene 5'-phosphate synthase
MKTLVAVLITILAAVGTVLAVLMLRFRRNQKRADEAWASFEPQPLDLEPVEQLAITPLVEARTTDDGLRGEAGVSYLIQADGSRILFDLGLNAQRTSPSALQHNAQVLGVDLDAVDAVVISHRHPDHVGGLKAQMAHSFILPTVQLETGGTPVYLPEPLQHPMADVCVVGEPQRVGPGVATIGAISMALFLMGWTPEQALAVNLAGKGIVLIVGCGHQGVHRIVERAEALFDEPLYGLVGGLHFPITGSPLQRIAGADRPPWKPLTKDDEHEVIHYLQDKGLRRIALSPHDSCDWTLNAFREAWGSDLAVVTVGQQIRFSGFGGEESV